MLIVADNGKKPLGYMYVCVNVYIHIHIYT